MHKRSQSLFSEPSCCSNGFPESGTTDSIALIGQMIPPIPPKPKTQRGRIAKSDAHNLWERLRDHEEAALLFAKISEKAISTPDYKRCFEHKFTSHKKRELSVQEIPVLHDLDAINDDQ